jgi:hypothetical protein
MKIYSNQFISENNIPLTEDGIQTTQEEWWFIYDFETKEIVIDPNQSYMHIFSPLTIIITNSLEECREYISTHGLSYPEYSEYFENN